MLKRVLAANSSWCREGPRINLRHGLTRTNESRAWPGVPFSSVVAANGHGISDALLHARGR
jgi:hypothetical protein